MNKSPKVSKAESNPVSQQITSMSQLVLTSANCGFSLWASFLLQLRCCAWWDKVTTSKIGMRIAGSHLGSRLINL